MYENAMTESVGMKATCNSCDRIIYEDENWKEQYKENGGYCKDCDPSKEVKEGGEDWEVKPFRTVTGLKYSIVSHYDVIAKCDKEDDAILLAQSKNMYYCLKDFMDIVKGISSVPVGSQLTVTIPASLFENASIVLQKATPKK